MSLSMCVFIINGVVSKQYTQHGLYVLYMYIVQNCIEGNTGQNSFTY